MKRTSQSFKLIGTSLPLVGLDEKIAQPFDEEMVGLNGPSRKSHENFVRRGFRKAGLPRPTSKQIEDTMAAAVLTYVTKEFSGK